MSPPLPHPERLVFVLYTDHNRTMAERRWSEATCIIVPDHKAADCRLTDFIVEETTKHVKKYGPLKELAIEGHGCRNVLGKTKQDCVASNQEDDFLYTSILVNRLFQFQKKDNQKIADRILFNGCETFSHLDEHDINFYRNYAQAMGTEMVGTHSVGKIVFFNAAMQARRVAFQPDGRVVRDREDDRFKLFGNFEVDRSWTEDYVDRTPKQTDRRLYETMIEKAKEYVSAQRRTDAEGAETACREIERLDRIAPQGKAVFLGDHVTIFGPGGENSTIRPVPPKKPGPVARF